MSNIRLNKNMIGKEVRLVKIINSYNPDKIGATGRIISYDEADENNMHYLVNWKFNGDEWETWPNDKEIEEVVENKDTEDSKEMTNEEIWEMLRPKMEKNNLKSTVSITYVPTLWDGKDLIESKKAYYEDDVHNAIALAYKVGYLRAMKGRSFKFGEKKKGGHWEPVDIKDVLKGECKVVENCLGWQYEHLGTYKKSEDGKFYQWVEDDK